MFYKYDNDLVFMTGHDYIGITCKAAAEHYGTCTSVALN
jgi:hypothetical protein